MSYSGRLTESAETMGYITTEQDGFNLSSYYYRGYHAGLSVLNGRLHASVPLDNGYVDIDTDEMDDLIAAVQETIDEHLREME